MGGGGGDGPEGHAAATGGAGAISGSSNAMAGVRGSGGGGGAGGTPGQAAGAPGGNGVEFDGVRGAGGGGGGGGYYNASNANGGAGGYYGGGGGGTAFAPGAGAGGSGAQGIIVVNYAPAAASLVTADASVSSETLESLLTIAIDPIQFVASTSRNCPLTAATERGIRQGLSNPIEDVGLARGNSIVPAESSRAAAAGGASLLLESVAAVRRQNDLEPAIEHLAATISAGSGFSLETAGRVDPLGLMPVSPGRLLGSPGRIRALAGPGSRLPLKGR